MSHMDYASIAAYPCTNCGRETHVIIENQAKSPGSEYREATDAEVAEYQAFYDAVHDAMSTGQGEAQAHAFACAMTHKPIKED